MALGMAQVTQAVPGSTGNQAFTVSLGGATPDCCFVHVVLGSASDNTLSGHVRQGYGVSDGTNQYAFSYSAKNAVGTTLTKRNRLDDAVIVAHDPDSEVSTVEATISSFSANTVTLNFSKVAVGRITVIAWSGVSYAKVGEMLMASTVDTSTSVTGMGGKPNTLILVGGGNLIPTSGGNSKPSIGFACYNGTAIKQGGIGYGCGNNDTATTNRARMADVRAYTTMSNSPQFNSAGEVTSFDSTGFTLTTREGTANNQELAYLAFYVPDDGVDLVEETLPNTTGDVYNTPYNFTGYYPAGILGIHSFVDGNNGTQDGDIIPGINFSSYTKDKHNTMFTVDEWAATTTNNASGSYSKPVYMLDDTQTLKYSADFVEWRPEGEKLNFTDADAGTHISIKMAFRGEQVPVFPTDWKRKQKLTTKSTYIDSNITNYVALIDEKQISDIGDEFWLKVQEGGGDIRITSDKAGTTQLPIDVVVCEKSIEHLQIWVKLDVTSTGGNSIYLWYGTDNTAVKHEPTDTYGANNVYDSNYLGVYHVEDPTVGGDNPVGHDSTSNNHHLTNNGTTERIGQLHSGRNFDGTDDYLYGGAGPSNGPVIGGTGSFAVEGWFEFDTVSQEMVLMCQRDPDAFFGQWRLRMLSTGVLRFTVFNGTWQWTTENGLEGTTVLSTGTKYHIVAGRNGDDGYIYINGVQEATANGTALSIDSNIDFSIGVNYRDLNGYFDGMGDEFRVSDTWRSADYIKLNYYSQLDTTNLWANVDPTFPTDWQKVLCFQSKGTYIDANLGSHTALVDAQQVNAEFWANVQDGGGDIRVSSDEAGLTELDFEVVECDVATGHLQLYVQIDLTTTGGNKVYIHYHPDVIAERYPINDTHGAENAWGSNYEAVYHFGKVDTFLDSTNHDNDATNNGTSQVTGLDGRQARLFDGVDDYIALPAGVHNLDSHTIEMWVKGASGQDDKRIYCEGSSTNDNPLLTLGTDDGGVDGKQSTYIRDDDGNVAVNHVEGSATDLFDGQWHHFAFRSNLTNWDVWIDGVGGAGGDPYTKATKTLDRYTLGAVVRATVGDYFTGQIQEVRLAKVRWSPNWIKATYYGQKDTTNLWGPCLDVPKKNNLSGNLHGMLSGGFQQ